MDNLMECESDCACGCWITKSEYECDTRVKRYPRLEKIALLSETPSSATYAYTNQINNALTERLRREIGVLGYSSTRATTTTTT